MLNLNQGHMSSRHVISNRKVHGGQLLRVFSFYPKRRWGSPMRFRRELEAERGIRCKGVSGGAVEIHPSTCHKNAAASAKKSAVAPWKPHTSTLRSNYAYQPHCPMKQLITKKKKIQIKLSKKKPKWEHRQQLDSLVSPLCWGGIQFTEAQVHRDTLSSPMGVRATGEWKTDSRGRRERVRGEKKEKKEKVGRDKEIAKSQQGGGGWSKKRKEENRKEENDHKQGEKQDLASVWRKGISIKAP